MPAEPPPKPDGRIIIHYSPRNAERMRRAGAVLREMFAAVAEEYGYTADDPEAAAPPPTSAPPFTEDELRKRPRYRGSRRRSERGVVGPAQDEGGAQGPLW